VAFQSDVEALDTETHVSPLGLPPGFKETSLFTLWDILTESNDVHGTRRELRSPNPIGLQVTATTESANSRLRGNIRRDAIIYSWTNDIHAAVRDAILLVP
jgi:hypothetical protein